MKQLLAFVLGGLFALGLMISGMSNPAKVLDFLDLFGDWNPSLAFVMIGAIVIAFFPFQYAIRSRLKKSLLGEMIDLPNKTSLDSSLIVGSLLFGVGWGIAGICPAPALTLVGLGYIQGFYFMLAMLLGMYSYQLYTRR